MWVQSLGWEDALEEETATHSSILAWRIPCSLVGGHERLRQTPLKRLSTLTHSPVKTVSSGIRSSENPFIKMSFQVILKFILLLKFLGQLCMLTNFTSELIYQKKIPQSIFYTL